MASTVGDSPALSGLFCPVAACHLRIPSLAPTSIDPHISLFPPPVGGEPGERGLNLLIRKDGRTVNLGGKTSVTVYPGVRDAACVVNIRDAKILIWLGWLCSGLCDLSGTRPHLC